MWNNLLDVHTHTLASGHAYGTLTEMAQAAAQRGLKVLGITEHGPAIPGSCDPIYFCNLRVVPRVVNGVRLLLGAEINIMDYQGTLDLEQWIIDRLDLRIAGIHAPYYTLGTQAENTAAVLGAIQNPSVDMISHPDDGRCPLDYPAVVEAAIAHRTLLEINNNAMRMPSRLNVAENILTILALCKEKGHPVILSSDAHYMTDVGNLDQVLPLLERVDFPEELVFNAHPEEFLAWLEENRRREQQVRTQKASQKGTGTVGYLDAVLLKDGRTACILEVYSPTVFEADIESSPNEWENGSITLDMIEKVIYRCQTSSPGSTTADKE